MKYSYGFHEFNCKPVHDMSTVIIKLDFTLKTHSFIFLSFPKNSLTSAQNSLYNQKLRGPVPIWLNKMKYTKYGLISIALNATKYNGVTDRKYSVMRLIHIFNPTMWRCCLFLFSFCPSLFVMVWDDPGVFDSATSKGVTGWWSVCLFCCLGYISIPFLHGDL